MVNRVNAVEGQGTKGVRIITITQHALYMADSITIPQASSIVAYIQNTAAVHIA